MVGEAFHFRGPVELSRFDDDTAYLINSMTLIISVMHCGQSRHSACHLMLNLMYLKPLYANLHTGGSSRSIFQPYE